MKKKSTIFAIVGLICFALAMYFVYNETRRQYEDPEEFEEEETEEEFEEEETEVTPADNEESQTAADNSRGTAAETV